MTDILGRVGDWFEENSVENFWLANFMWRSLLAICKRFGVSFRMPGRKVYVVGVGMTKVTTLSEQGWEFGCIYWFINVMHLINRLTSVSGGLQIHYNFLKQNIKESGQSQCSDLFMLSAEFLPPIESHWKVLEQCFNPASR